MNLLGTHTVRLKEYPEDIEYFEGMKISIAHNPQAPQAQGIPLAQCILCAENEYQDSIRQRYPSVHKTDSVLILLCDVYRVKVSPDYKSYVQLHSDASAHRLQIRMSR